MSRIPKSNKGPIEHRLARDYYYRSSSEDRACARYELNPPSWQEIETAILEFVRSSESHRIEQADATGRRFLRDFEESSRSPTPKWGVTTEQVAMEAWKRFPGIPRETVQDALRDLERKQLIHRERVTQQDDWPLLNELAKEGGPNLRTEVWRDGPGPVQDAATHGDGTQRADAAPLTTDGQRSVWEALNNRAMTGKELAKALHTSGETIRQHVSDLRKAGYQVPNRRGRGYYRPDAPPDDFR